ncbi:MAG: hypothetical protein IPH24_17725 [Crocinitomicaceae bacterium]|nr:hypothetical protein [Crocinitomicaceae bacterium]
MAAKLESIDLRLAQMNEQMTELNEKFTRIVDNTDNLYPVEFGGEIDDHLTVTGAELKAIHEANPPPENPDNGTLSL